MIVQHAGSSGSRAESISIRNHHPVHDLLAMADSIVWTSENLKAFIIKMQLRISQILHSYEARATDKNKWPRDMLFTDNLLGELVR